MHVPVLRVFGPNYNSGMSWSLGEVEACDMYDSAMFLNTRFQMQRHRIGCGHAKEKRCDTYTSIYVRS